MKRRLILILTISAIVLMAMGCKKSGSDDGAFTPSRDVEWTCTSNPGGGSDIFSQQIKDVITTEGYSDANIVINYVTDGGGEVGRLQVSTTKGSRADHTLLTFNSGDLMPMVQNTDNRVENFTPLAVLAVDKQLLFKGENSKYDTFADVLEALANGEHVVIAGSKGDDIETYYALIAELGVPENQLSYITNDSTSGAITSLLGGHVDLCMSKPAAAEQYVIAGKMTPVLALSTERFSSDLLKDAPTLSELGDYEDVEVPVWRGVVGPKNMSEEAAAYWVECLEKVSSSDRWNTNYIEKNGLISVFYGGEDALKYMTDYQSDYLVKIGKEK